MGGEGSMLNAIKSLKNNRALLSKRKDKSSLRGSYYKIKLKTFPETSPEKLAEIQARIKRENKKTFIKTLFVFTFLLISLIGFFYCIIKN